MKYNEAKKAIEALSSKYSVNTDKLSVYFNINYKGVEIAFVNSDIEYNIGIGNPKNFYKLPFSNKLYMIMSELAMTPVDARVEEKKYYVKIFDGELGYLNIDISTGKLTAGSVLETESIRSKFTDKAIEQLKQRDDIPLDWDKVRFEEAN